jgi:diguanylate cyclase (GGDEF)-like protein
LYKDPDSFLDSVHPEEKEEVAYKFKNALENFHLEYRIIRPDGDVRWIFAKTFVVDTGERTDNIRVAGIAQDITERKKLEEQLRETSIRDPLTGLYNRRHIVERVTPLVEKARRNKDLFSLAILDIDHFKHINDTYGHVAGDQVLKELAVILNGNVRTYDLVGRFGGEEFIIIFMDIGKEQAGNLAERILEITRGTVIRYEGEEITFTFSCGVTDATSCIEAACPLEGLINEADELLYKAKSAGRNRVLI